MSGLQIVELEAGTRISFYEVLPIAVDPEGKPIRTCVGYGGFGALYKVARGNKIYALKLAHEPAASYSAEERQWLEERGDREIATLKSLRHPNIVRVHAFDRWPDEDGRGFIVMDFIEGSTLDHWRVKTGPSLRRICEVFRSIALALHAAHRQDIFHRDLKCSNVLVRTDGEPVIVDWGIARPASTYTITRARTMVGTYTCFAPEYCLWAFSQSNDRFETTPATELYVVGYMFYELLTGRAPVARESDDVATMRSIIKTVPARPSSINPAVPAELDELVMQLLHKDPASRFPTGDALAQRITELLGSATPTWDQPLEAAPLAMAAAATRKDGVQASTMSTSNKAKPAPLHAEKEAAPQPKLSLASFHKPEFVSIEAAPTIPQAPQRKESSILPAIAAAAQRLRGQSRRNVPPVVLVIGLVGAAVAIVVALASFGRRDETRRPENLLANVQRAEELAADGGTATAVRSKEAPHSTLPPAPLVNGETIEPRPAGARRRDEQSAPQKRLDALSDATDIDHQLHARFGRPTLRPDGTLEKKAPPSTPPSQIAPEDDQPAWLKPLQTAAPPAVPVAKELGVSSGAHIRARLLTNLDSRTVGDGPAEAKLVRAFLVDGRAVFPAGTVFLGQAQTSGARFTIRFYRLRLPDRREFAFEGLAYDLTEKKPGLPASRRIENGGARQGEAVAAKVAKGVADTLLTAASGGTLPSELAVGASRTMLNGQSDQPRADASGNVLLLDANLDFDVFVVRAF